MRRICELETSLQIGNRNLPKPLDLGMILLAGYSGDGLSGRPLQKLKAVTPSFHCELLPKNSAHEPIDALCPGIDCATR
jgi:hypothetical protein